MDGLLSSTANLFSKKAGGPPAELDLGGISRVHDPEIRRLRIVRSRWRPFDAPGLTAH